MNTVSPLKERQPEWVENIKKRIQDNRQKRFDEKKMVYQDKLQEMVNLYFQYHSEDENENTNIFNELNKEWKEMCHKVNSTQSLVNIDHKAFENGISLVKERNKKKSETSENSELQNQNNEQTTNNKQNENR